MYGPDSIASRAVALIAGKTVCAAAGALRAVTKHAGGQLRELERVAAEVRHLGKVVLVDGSADVAGFRVDHWRFGGVDGHRLRRSANLKY